MIPRITLSTKSAPPAGCDNGDAIGTPSLAAAAGFSHRNEVVPLRVANGIGNRGSKFRPPAIALVEPVAQRNLAVLLFCACGS